MNEIHVIVTSPEEAYDYAAEFWCGKPTRCAASPRRSATR